MSVILLFASLTLTMPSRVWLTPPELVPLAYQSAPVYCDPSWDAMLCATMDEMRIP